MASPKRYPFKNLAAIKREYRGEFLCYFIIGAVALWPVAILVGKRAMVYSGGVPVAPYQRWIHNWPNVYPNRTTFRFFRRYALGTMFVGSFLFAYRMSDMSIYNNQWYTRPDLKQKPAMVDETYVYDKEVYDQLLRNTYSKYRHDEIKKSTWYRMLWPAQADWNTKASYSDRNKVQNYNNNGQFPTFHHDYSDHLY